MATRDLVAPIVILGAPRSGTTFLADLLDSHPAVARAREARLVWRYGNDHRTDELGPSDARPPVVEHIRRHFADLVQDQGGGRLVEKTPANSVRPAFVNAVFPDARFVHITRDGWACVPSMRDFWARRATGLDAKQRAKAVRRLREARPRQVPAYARELLGRGAGRRSRHQPLYGPRLAGLQQVVDELGVLDAAGFQWRECVSRSVGFGRGAGGARYLEIKLEALDVPSVERLLTFCELDVEPSVIEAFRSSFDPNAASRRAVLTDDERGRVATFIEPANEWLGYPSA